MFVASFLGSPPMNLLPARLAGDGRLVVGEAHIALDGALTARGGPRERRVVRHPP